MQKVDINSPKAVIEKMIQLVEGGWIQCCGARTAKNEPVVPENHSATQFDICGAMYAAFHRMGQDQNRELFYKVRDILIKAVKTITNQPVDEDNWKYLLTRWNDGDDRTKEDVVRFLKLALEG